MLFLVNKKRLLVLLAAFIILYSLSMRYGNANSTPSVDTVTASATSWGNESAFSLTEGTTTTLYVHGTITDPDGCNDIAQGGTITGKVYRSDVPGGADCAADNTNCYTITNAQCVQSGCTGDGDTTLDYQCSIPIQYYADSTMSGPHAATDWTARITATDASSASGSGTGTIEMNSTIALHTTPSIDYGTINFNDQSAEQTLTVTNTGNTGIDVMVSANGVMSCNSGSIDASNVHYASTPALGYDLGVPLSTTPTKIELDLSHQTQDGIPETKNIYTTLKMPELGIGGNCSNMLITTATADTDNGW